MEADTHETQEDRMYKQSKTDTEVSALLYTRMCACSLLPLRAEHAEVALVTPLSVLLSGGEELVCLFRELLCNRSETNLTLEVVLELIPLRLFGVERERVLAFSLELRVVTPEVPVTALNSFGFFGLRFTHTCFQTVVDTRSVSDDERRSRISLRLADSLEGLSLVSAHSDLCYINISVRGSNHTEVFLTNALTHRSELSDSAERRCLGCLTTGVGVHLGIEHEDVDIFAGSDLRRKR